MAHLCRIDKCLGSNAEAQFKYQDKNSICAVRDRFRVPGIPEKRTIVAPVRDRCGKFGPTGTERGREGVDGGGVFSIVFGNFSPFLHYTWGRRFAQSSQGKNVDFYFSNPNSVMIGFIMIRRAFTDLVNVNNNKSFRSKCQNNGLRRVDGD
jgi:hypothetical protein